jgi:trk system potassium uptake protein TrkH
MLGYASYVAIGFLVLRMPWSHAVPVAPIDDLFMATSAVSTTGLVTVSTADTYTLFGEICLLALIQLGGLGYMTLGSFTIIARRDQLSELRDSVARTVFTLPEGFQAGPFVARVVGFSLGIEALGAAMLFAIFRRAGLEDPLWSAVFHSVSAFCTAGFGLYDDSFESLQGNVYLNAVLGLLSLSGAVGFIVLADYFRRFSGHGTPVTYTSRVIVRATWIPLAVAALRPAR